MTGQATEQPGTAAASNEGGEQQGQGTEGTKPEGAGNTAGGQPNAEQQSDAQKTANDKGDGSNEPKPGGEVDYTFELPEGFVPDEARASAFKEVAKKHGLSKEAAQEIVNLAAQAEQARIEAHTTAVKAWADDVAKDPDLGKPEAQAAMRQTIDTFGSPALKELLNTTGFGNHPEVVRFVHKVAKAMSEDSIKGGSNGNQHGAKDAASILYGNT